MIWSLKTIITIGALVFFGIAFFNDSSAYFQPYFHCSFVDGEFQISNGAHNGSRNCMDLLTQLKARRVELSQQLQLPHADSDYNTYARIQLIKQRGDIDAIVTQIVSGVNDLEQKIYLSYKKRYFSKLKPIRSKLVAKQSSLAAELASSTLAWEKAIMAKVIKTVGFNYQRIKLIEGILTSKSLDEMIPLLETYETLIANQLLTSAWTWKSE